MAPPKQLIVEEVGVRLQHYLLEVIQSLEEGEEACLLPFLVKEVELLYSSSQQAVPFLVEVEESFPSIKEVVVEHIPLLAMTKFEANTAD